MRNHPKPSCWYCYQPLHIYEGQTGKLITAILRPGVRPTGKEVVSILKRLIAYLRQAWPNVAILLRGDSHFSCPEVHDLCDAFDVYFVLGQSGNAKLLPLAQPLMDQAKALYAASGKTVRLYTSWDYQASTWSSPRRIICKFVHLQNHLLWTRQDGRLHQESQDLSPFRSHVLSHV